MIVRRLTMLAALLTAAACATEESTLAGNDVPGGDPERGKRLMYVYGCGSCHIIPGVGAADGVVGPPLTAWASRQWIAGRLPNQPDSLIAWLLDPQAIEPGTAMPTQGMRPDEARHMAAYLFTLGGEELGPPHPLSPKLLEKMGGVHHADPGF